MSVPNCFNPLENTDSKTKSLIATSALLFLGNITWLSTASSISQPLITSEVPKCPVKHLSFTKEADFSKLMRQFSFPGRNAEAEAAQCTISPTMEGSVTTHSNLVAFLVSLELWSLEFHHEGPGTVWNNTNSGHIIEGYYISDGELGCLLFPYVCLN